MWGVWRPVRGVQFQAYLRRLISSEQTLPTSFQFPGYSSQKPRNRCQGEAAILSPFFACRTRPRPRRAASMALELMVKGGREGE